MNLALWSVRLIVVIQQDPNYVAFFWTFFVQCVNNDDGKKNRNTVIYSFCFCRMYLPLFCCCFDVNETHCRIKTSCKLSFTKYAR